MKASCHDTEIATRQNVCFMAIVGHVYTEVEEGKAPKPSGAVIHHLARSPSFCCNLLRVYVGSTYIKKRLPTCPLFINKGGEPFLQQSVDAKRATL